MPGRRIGQYRVCSRTRRLVVLKPQQWLPRRENRYFYEWGCHLLLVQWQPYKALYPLSLHRACGEKLVNVIQFPDLWVYPMKQINLGAGDKLPAVPLSAESVIFRKFPLLRHFMTALVYENGTPRLPGRVWWENDGVAFTAVLMDPTGCARVRLRAATIDDLWTAVEAHLGAENAPWEVDQYARDRQAKKKGK